MRNDTHLRTHEDRLLLAHSSCSLRDPPICLASPRNTSARIDWMRDTHRHVIALPQEAMDVLDLGFSGTVYRQNDKSV